MGIAKDKKGMSVIIVRTARGEKILLDAQKAGYITLDKVDAEAVLENQKIESNRKNWTIYTYLWEKAGKIAPAFHIHKKWKPDIDKIKKNAHLRKLNWSMDLTNSLSPQELNKRIRRHILFIKIMRLSIIKRIIKMFKLDI